LSTPACSLRAKVDQACRRRCPPAVYRPAGRFGEVGS
jgi:hypothetical protein